MAAMLLRLATNHRWSWHLPTDDLLSRCGVRGGAEIHPAELVGSLGTDELADIASDDELVAAIRERTDELAAVESLGARASTIAYFSPEFGIDEAVPQYSGGLGILAGDHLKASSDLGLPLVGVGLFYAEGFFRQDVEENRQAERYEPRSAGSLGHIDTGCRVSIDIDDEAVEARVWECRVGSVRTLLLDTDLDSNSTDMRRITDRLYGGDRLHRLRQELVLGMGGMRALAALGIEPEVLHLNEGHAGFSLLIALEPYLAAGLQLAEAIRRVAPSIVFTTHTPVPAGIDRFDRDLVRAHLEPWCTRLGVRFDDLADLAFLPTDGPGRPFNMAALCLEIAGAANGVSLLHGEESRQLFATLPAGARIGSVTNGVHARTWTSRPVQELFDDVLGPGWDCGHPSAWARAADLDDEIVAGVRRRGRELLGRDVADRSGVALDPDAPIVGFARRFATYKRADLLLCHPERLVALLGDDEQPIQFVFAGKAHPADREGKALLARIAEFASSPEANGRFHFIADYDMGLARSLYAGCDVWLNNPVRPREASGTSGEKSALNGGLNCSISDGWWDEMADGVNGWTIPVSDVSDPQERDEAEALAVHRLLSEEIAPGFHRNPAGWADRVRHVWMSLGPLVTAARMVAEYDALYYDPARAAGRANAVSVAA